jgi:hypothetical protein
MPHLSRLSKLKNWAHKKETTRPIILGINADTNDALNPSVEKEYCVSVTEIIKHDATKPYWEVEIQLNASLNVAQNAV